MKMATFFDLPLELRDHIYTLILTLPDSTTTTASQQTQQQQSQLHHHDQPTRHHLAASPDPDEISISWPVSMPPAASTNLLLLNRQIHREATHCMRRLVSQGKLSHRLAGTLTASYVLGITWLLVPVSTRRIANMAISVGVEAPADEVDFGGFSTMAASPTSPRSAAATAAATARFDARLWWRVLRERTGKILYTLVCQAIRFQHVDPTTGPRFLLGGPPRVTIDELVLDFHIADGSSRGREVLDPLAKARLHERQAQQLEEWIPHCVRMLKRVIQLVTKLDGLPSDLMSLPVLRKRAALRGIRVIKVGMGGKVMESFNVEEHFS